MILLHTRLDLSKLESRFISIGVHQGQIGL